MEADASVIAYRMRGLPEMRFVRRPMTTLPPDGFVGIVDHGTATHPDGYTAGVFKDGTWHNTRGRPMRKQPTFWTELVKDD